MIMICLEGDYYFKDIMLTIKVCCGFGHREVFENISEKVYEAVLTAADQGCKIFYTGAMGRFDEMFSSSVRILKKDYPNTKLICVKPYFSKDINENGEFLYSLYDDIIIPSELADIHYKKIITKRNQCIIDRSDFVVGYTIRDYGGAYNAIKYAKEQGKRVLLV